MALAVITAEIMEVGAAEAITEAAGEVPPLVQQAVAGGRSARGALVALGQVQALRVVGLLAGEEETTGA